LLPGRGAGQSSQSGDRGPAGQTVSPDRCPASRWPGGGDGMFAWVIPLLTLTAMEIVLGIDNIIFIALGSF